MEWVYLSPKDAQNVLYMHPAFSPFDAEHSELIPYSPYSDITPHLFPFSPPHVIPLTTLLFLDPISTTSRPPNPFLPFLLT